MMTSSANWLMCVNMSVLQKRKSTIKSLSHTESIEFSVTPSNPSSAARNSRSTPNALPASAPHPRGQTFARGIISTRRFASLFRAAAWLISQWLSRTGCAGCKCVYPAIRIPTCLSLKSAIACRSSPISDSTFRSASTHHRRVSVATWSFLDRPVCSLPPAGPMISVRRRSLAVWMSSSPGLISNESEAHSDATVPRPATMASHSSSVRIPTLQIALA
mmetsp:Transcript_34485/g.67847  ORF Transcript_34485/g.67847 Transcript_34485/m.67847 type:complete len:218 (+) Transcript_34485:767-1420(+)